MKLSSITTAGRASDTHVLDPAVVTTMVHVVLCILWFLWLRCTAHRPVVGSAEAFRFVTTAQYAAASAVNVLLAAALVLAAGRTLRAGDSLGRARLAGAALGLVLLALLQLSLLYAHGPISVPH